MIVFSRHSTNLLTNLPRETIPLLVPAEEGESSGEGADTDGRRSFEGHDVQTLVEILGYLETVLESASLARQKEILLPVLSCLTSLCRANRICRKFCRMRVSHTIYYHVSLPMGL